MGLIDLESRHSYLIQLFKVIKGFEEVDIGVDNAGIGKLLKIGYYFGKNLVKILIIYKFRSCMSKIYIN